MERRGHKMIACPCLTTCSMDTCNELFGHRRGDVLIWFLLLSLYSRRVYSNDLGIFIPPLMLRAMSSLLSTFFLVRHVYVEIDSLMKVLEENPLLTQ